MIKPSKLAPWSFLASFYSLYILLSYLGNAYFFSWPFLDTFYSASSGLIHPTLVLNGIWIGIFSILFIGFGKFNLRDFGLQTSLARGALFTLLLWLMIQVAVVVWQLTSGNVPRLAPNLSREWTYLLGLLLAQLFGNALQEEAVWRGFLLPQMFFKLKPRLGGGAVYAAVVVSVLAFTLMHIPNRLFRYGDSSAELIFWLLAIFAASLIFTFVFLQSGNLYVAVGFHALFNTQVLIVAVPAAASLRSDLITDTLAVVCGLALLFFFRRRERKIAREESSPV